MQRLEVLLWLPGPVEASVPACAAARRWLPAPACLNGDVNVSGPYPMPCVRDENGLPWRMKFLSCCIVDMVTVASSPSDFKHRRSDGEISERCWHKSSSSLSSAAKHGCARQIVLVPSVARRRDNLPRSAKFLSFH